MIIIPRIKIFIVASNSLIFFNKTHFYQNTLEECSKEMTLAGQETRIM